MPRALIFVTVLIASAVGFAPSAVARRAVVSTRLAAQNVNVNILPVRNSFSNFRGARAARSESRLPPPAAQTHLAGNFTVDADRDVIAPVLETIALRYAEYAASGSDAWDATLDVHNRCAANTTTAAAITTANTTTSNTAATNNTTTTRKILLIYENTPPPK